jgi:hypothetical protein
MGGQNHQPTNRILTAASALLSQRVSDGFAAVLMANSHLEDAIMLGMDKRYVADLTPNLAGAAIAHIEAAIEKIENSKALLLGIDQAFERLFFAAQAEHYVGNPLASQVKAMGLTKLFEGGLIQPAVNETIWRELEQRIESSNILKTLEWERGQFKLLCAPTECLVQTLKAGAEIVVRDGARSFVDALEDNRLPLRQYYAQVFSAWNYLQCMFLYSALIMTELYYRANGFPSLAEFTPVDIRQSVA